MSFFSAAKPKFFKLLFSPGALLIAIYLLALGSLFVDQNFSLAVTEMRFADLDSIMIWFTNFGLLFVTLILLGGLFIKRQVHVLTLIALSFAVALEVAFITKMVFQVPRPYELLEIINLVGGRGLSFPSLHVAFVFAALPFLSPGFKSDASRHEEKLLAPGRTPVFGTPAINLKPFFWIWLIFSLLMGFSRVYVGVHYLSDVCGGVFLGLAIGFGLRALENRTHFIVKFFHHIHDKFELRRQIGHMIIGLAIIFLVKLHLVNISLLFIILIIGGFSSLLLRKFRIPILYPILTYFERPHHLARFPGRGSFFMVLGSLISLILFPQPVAFAAIAILAVGDSVTNVFGRYFGSFKNPFNHKKTIEGSLFAVLVSTLVAWFFIPFNAAFWAALAAMFLESLDLKIGRFELDDNILVPLVAGWVALLLL